MRIFAALLCSIVVPRRPLPPVSALTDMLQQDGLLSDLREVREGVTLYFDIGVPASPGSSGPQDAGTDVALRHANAPSGAT